MFKILTFVFILTALTIVILSCTDEENYITRVPIANAVYITGTIKIWKCGIHDWYNNPIDGSLLTDLTDEPAQITILGDNGFYVRTQSDNSSEFSLAVSEGNYTAIVETGYSQPDTFYNLQFSAGDTNLVLDILIDVLNPELLDFNFYYRDPDDSLGIKAEWDLLLEINKKLYDPDQPYPLEITRFTNPSVSRSTRMWSWGSYSVHYLITINRYDMEEYKYHIWDVFLSVYDLIHADTTGKYEYLTCNPAGAYICRGK